MIRVAPPKSGFDIPNGSFKLHWLVRRKRHQFLKEGPLSAGRDGPGGKPTAGDERWALRPLDRPAGDTGGLSLVPFGRGGKENSTRARQRNIAHNFVERASLKIASLTPRCQERAVLLPSVGPPAGALCSARRLPRQYQHLCPVISHAMLDLRPMPQRGL